MHVAGAGGVVLAVVEPAVALRGRANDFPVDGGAAPPPLAAVVFVEVPRVLAAEALRFGDVGLREGGCVVGNVWHDESGLNGEWFRVRGAVAENHATTVLNRTDLPGL